MRLYQHLTAVLISTLIVTAPLHAADYVIDTKGGHASINFRIQHLGYSWLIGRFNTFSGTFSYDEDHPSMAKVSIEIDTGSVDSNHAERDKHLRGNNFLEAKRYPKASFISSSFKELGGGKALLTGDLTLMGLTKPITIDVEHTGNGRDPWGGYRRGFRGTTKLGLKDWSIMFELGAASQEVELELVVEGIRQ
ncbi:MAG: YceI family protein [Candidatus Polarisedimenticolaceae bacterium]|nr:YceI family protein [Candidatus Polarisedimenticolaceae bacterium]